MDDANPGSFGGPHDASATGRSESDEISWLLESIDIGVLFLDSGRRIRRFTPSATRLIGLTTADVGRPVEELLSRLDDPDLDADCRDVMQRRSPIGRETSDAGGRHYLRRVLPYFTPDGRGDGVVITFVDITERRAAEAALAAEKEYAESIVETLHEPLLVLLPDLTIRGVNTAFYNDFRVSPAETIGRKLYELGNGQWDIPALRRLLEDVLPSSKVFNDYEVIHEFESIGRRVMLVNGRRLDHVPLILLGIRDITGRKRDEDDRRRGEERQAFLLTLSDAIGPLGDAGAIRQTAARVLGRHLGAGRVAYAEDCGDDLCYEVATNYVDGLADASGRFRYADFGPDILSGLRAGRIRVQPDTRNDPGLSEAEKLTLAGYGVVASLNVPLVKEGRLVAFLGVNYPVPHEFPEHEVDLVKEVAERTWAAVERARAEAALAAELEAMTRLRELAGRLLAATDLTAAMGEVLDTAIALHSADRGTAQMYEPSTGGLRCVAARGFGGAVLPVVDRAFHSPCAAALRSGEPVMVAEIPTDPRFVEHAEVAASLGYRAAFSVPLRIVRGKCLGVLTVHFEGRREATGRDLRWAALYAPLAAHLIERQQAEGALREGEERLRLSLDVGGLATWDWDVQTGRVVWNDAHFAMQGYAVGEVVPSYEAWVARLHPADRAPTVAAVEAARDGRIVFRREYRTNLPDGSVRWLSARGTFFYDDAGAPARMIGVARDVTDQRESEAALRASEQLLRAVATNLPNAAVFVVTPELRYTLAEGHALRTAGFVPSDLEGKLVSEVLSPDLLAEYAPHYRRALAGENLSLEHAAHGRHFATHLAPLRDPGGRTVAALAVSYDITDRVQAEEEVRRANDDLEARVVDRTAALAEEMARRRELGRRLSTAQEDERLRISRDLHDTIGQLMTGLTLAFKAMEASADLPAASAERLAEAQRIAGSLGKEVHALAVRLRPTALDDFGLETALRHLVVEWATQTGVEADFQAVGLDRLDREIETAVYRIVQESLTNAGRHGRATRVGVVVTRRDGYLIAAVEDDGVGFDPDSVPAGRLGLVGMRERAELVGGELDLEFGPVSGTTVLVRIPIPNPRPVTPQPP